MKKKVKTAKAMVMTPLFRSRVVKSKKAYNRKKDKGRVDNTGPFSLASLQIAVRAVV